MRIKVILFCFLLGSISPIMCNDRSKTSNEVVELKEEHCGEMAEIRDCLKEMIWEIKKINMTLSLLGLSVSCLILDSFLTNRSS